MTEVAVRRAEAGDAAGITRVHVQAWRETYTEIVAAEFLARLHEVIDEARWESTIAGGADVFVAIAGGEVVGWSIAGDGRDDDAPAPRELDGLYLLAAFHGSGAGQMLLEAAIGDEAAYLWIAEGNPRAEAFYAKNGFARDGHERVTPFADQLIDTVRMVRG